MFSWIVRDQIAAMAMPVHEDLRKLRAGGVSLLVSAVPEPFDPQAVSRAGLRQLHLPIEYWRSPDEEQTRDFIAATKAELETGGKVVVHCIGGIGRTGTLIASYLVSEGMDPEKAIAIVRRQRPGSIESIEQENAVYAWAAAEARRAAEFSPDNGDGDGSGAGRRIEEDAETSDADAGDTEQSDVMQQSTAMLLEERDTTMAEAVVRAYLKWGTNGSEVDIRALSAGLDEAPRVEDLKAALRAFNAQDGVTVTLTEVLGREGEAWVTVSCAPGRQASLLVTAGEIVDQLVRASVYDEVLLCNP